MQINEAKNIPVEALAEKLGACYSHTDRQGDKWYFSPFRPDEKTASFKINTKKNVWHDFGMSNTFAHQKQSSGGDILDLWCDYHFKDRRAGIKQALAALKDIIPSSGGEKRFAREQVTEKPILQVQQPRYKIIKIEDRIRFSGLKGPFETASLTLQKADIL